MPRKNILRVAMVVGMLLLIPLFGNIFVSGWQWGVIDFVVMGTLLFVAGLAIDLAIRTLGKPSQRILAVAAIVLVLLLLWVELAVDAVSQAIRFLLK